MGRRWTTDRQRGGLAIAVIAVIGQIGLSAPASAAPDEGVPPKFRSSLPCRLRLHRLCLNWTRPSMNRLSRSSNPSNRVRSSPLVR